MARILIVEDEALLCLMLEQYLIDLGHEPVGPANTVAAALKLADQAPFDAAILDLHLGNERSDAIAEYLTMRKLPFAFATGGSTDDLTTRYADHPHVSKPYELAAIRSVVEQLVGNVSAGTK